MKTFGTVLVSLLFVSLFVGCQPPTTTTIIHHGIERRQLESSWDGNFADLAFDTITNLMFDFDIKVHPTQTSKAAGKLVAKGSGGWSNQDYNFLVTSRDGITSIRLKLFYGKDTRVVTGEYIPLRARSTRILNQGARDAYRKNIVEFIQKLREALQSKLGSPKSYEMKVVETKCWTWERAIQIEEPCDFG